MDAIAWTDAGRAALAAEQRATRRADPDAALEATIAAVVARYAPAWERGLAASDDVGRAAIARARAGWDLATMTPVDAAAIASLLGARGDGDARAFAELALRRRGAPFAIAMVIAMWDLATDYQDPDWPRSEARLAVRLRVLAPDDAARQDASVSYAKAEVAAYLGARQREAADPALVDAARVAWAAAPRHARAPIAVAADDRALAETILRDHLTAGEWPFFAAQHLPPLVRDPALIAQLAARDALPFSYRWLDALGVAALPYYAAGIAARKTGKWSRQRLLAQLADVVVGPDTAAILAPYRDKADYRAPVRAYFARHPELAPAQKAKAKAKAKKPAVKPPRRSARAGAASRSRPRRASPRPPGASRPRTRRPA